MTVVFGRRLKDLRTQKHMTQSDIGDYLHVSKVSVSGYENGTREPDQESSIKLANLFDVTLDYLYGRNETPSWAKQKDTIDLKSFLDKNLVGAFYDGNELTDEQRDKLKIALTQIFWDQRKKERSDTDDIDKGNK
ncbi:MAG TPA: transcriptional regulator [Lactobacillus sp.]|nr:transcriptional regulator [Lactobacillus sp.]